MTNPDATIIISVIIDISPSSPSLSILSSPPAPANSDGKAAENHYYRDDPVRDDMDDDAKDDANADVL